MRRLGLVVAPLVLALAASACGGGNPNGTAVDGPGATVARRSLVVLVRYGGAEGTSDRVEVDSTGEAVITSDRASAPKVRALSDADLSALRNALERSQIATLQRNYLDPKAEIAFQYDVTYQGVTVTTDAGVVPRQLQPVVDILDKLLG